MLHHWKLHKGCYRAVVVAQLVERSLPTPEVRGSIPIGDINIDQYSTNCNLEKTKIKKKRPGMAHLKKNIPLPS